jgi:hypothetical protein
MSAAVLLQAALFLAPALLLWALLARGRYPGEALVEALSRRRRSPWARSGAGSPLRRAPRRRAPAPRNLLAYSLAGRGPPARAQQR